MKIVFFGSSEFAIPSLKMLLGSKHKVLAVLTQPDRKKGRSLKTQATPVKNALTSKDIPIHQSEDIKDAATIKYLKSLSADLFIVVAFGQILPAEILSIPKIYSINLHASLLPKYRGAAPINWAVVKGETKTGLSIIRMTEKMDAGDIILQRKLPIEAEDTSDTLHHKLSELGAILLLDAIRFIEMDKITFKKQSQRAVTLAPKLKKEDGTINWQKSAKEIHNQIRGLLPWPGAFTFLDKKTLKIWKSETLNASQKPDPGTITDIRDDGFIVGCGKNYLIIKEVQLEGKKRMSASDFVRGFRELEKGTRFNV